MGPRAVMQRAAEKDGRSGQANVETGSQGGGQGEEMAQEGWPFVKSLCDDEGDGSKPVDDIGMGLDG